ncbi:MAG: peptide deformylase [Alphaproteobacteria bacterium]|jgi:peptide deformylase|nr:peptide deformylase [Alphaproteobacteria bacterium]
MNIVTIYNDPECALGTKAAPIEMTKEGLGIAKIIVEDLRKTLLPLIPAAGLAAPQMGIKRRVIIFSWDRTFDHLRAAINPSYEPLDQETVFGWEACFSSAPKEGPCRATHLPRFQKILATYYDLDGNKLQFVMEGFAAKVFQHECDHLDGMVNVHVETAEIKEFPSYEAFTDFMITVKQNDSVSYLEPFRY